MEAGDVPCLYCDAGGGTIHFYVDSGKTVVCSQCKREVTVEEIRVLLERINKVWPPLLEWLESCPTEGGEPEVAEEAIAGKAAVNWTYIRLCLPETLFGPRRVLEKLSPEKFLSLLDCIDGLRSKPLDPFWIRGEKADQRGWIVRSRSISPAEVKVGGCVWGVSNDPMTWGEAV